MLLYNINCDNYQNPISGNVVSMASYQEFIDNIERSACHIGQKSRKLNGKLRDAIAALSRDPKAAPEGMPDLASLSALSEIAREARCGALKREVLRLVQRMLEADRELVALDEQIERDIICMHSSITSDCVVPEAESARLAAHFTSWQDASMRLESSRAQLEALALRVEDAIEACEKLASSPSIKIRGKNEGGRKTRGADEAADNDETEESLRAGQHTVESLLEIRSLLTGIASLFIRRNDFKFGLKHCCAKIAACRLAHIPSPTSIRHHDKPRIKYAASILERKLSAFRNGHAAESGEMRLFFKLLQSMQKVHSLIPAQVYRQESQSIARANGFIERAIRTGDFSSINASGLNGMGKMPNAATFLQNSMGYPKLFMLDAFERFFDTSQYDLYVMDSAHAVSNPVLRASILHLLDIMGEEIFYSQAEVSDVLHRYSMDEYMTLIPPFAFAHERVKSPLLTVVSVGSDETRARELESFFLVLLKIVQ